MTLGESFWYLGDAPIAADQFQKARTSIPSIAAPTTPTRSRA